MTIASINVMSITIFFVIVISVVFGKIAADKKLGDIVKMAEKDVNDKTKQLTRMPCHKDMTLHDILESYDNYLDKEENERDDK